MYVGMYVYVCTYVGTCVCMYVCFTTTVSITISITITTITIITTTIIIIILLLSILFSCFGGQVQSRARQDGQAHRFADYHPSMSNNSNTSNNSNSSNNCIHSINSFTDIVYGPALIRVSATYSPIVRLVREKPGRSSCTPGDIVNGHRLRYVPATCRKEIVQLERRTHVLAT